MSYLNIPMENIRRSSVVTIYNIGQRRISNDFSFGLMLADNLNLDVEKLFQIKITNEKISSTGKSQ